YRGNVADAEEFSTSLDRMLGLLTIRRNKNGLVGYVYSLAYGYQVKCKHRHFLPCGCIQGGPSFADCVLVALTGAQIHPKCGRAYLFGRLINRVGLVSW